MLFTSLDTDRFTLKPIDNTDAEFILKQFSNPEINLYLKDAEPITELSEANEIIDFYTIPEPRRQNRWIAINKADEQKVGTCGYHNWDRGNNIVEIGWDLYPDYWGNGYMQEITATILAMGFNDMDLNRVEAYIDIRNTRSINLAKKLGFMEEGIVRDKHLFKGKYYDHYCYSLLKRDWQNR